MNTSSTPALPHRFVVSGSPVSVNRYGSTGYRNWRAEVLASSVTGATWSGCLHSTGCAVHIRYWRHLDRPKDVDNILKAILDGLDGKAHGGPKTATRVLQDDRDVEQVTSRRTKIDFSTKLDGRRLRGEEYAAALEALSAGAAVFVSVGDAPDHARSVLR